MTRARRMWGVLAIGSVPTAALGGAARAGEEDDLQRQIDTQKSSVADLERLDELKAVTDEIAPSEVLAGRGLGAARQARVRRGPRRSSTGRSSRRI